MKRGLHISKRMQAKLHSTVLQQRRDTIYKLMMKRHGFVPCFVCGRHVKDKHASLEHKQHVSDGGTDDMENLAISHVPCNQRRSNSDMECVGAHYYERSEDGSDA